MTKVQVHSDAYFNDFFLKNQKLSKNFYKCGDNSCLLSITRQTEPHHSLNNWTKHALQTYPLNRTIGFKFFVIFLTGSCVVLVEVQTLPKLISCSPAGLPLLGVWGGHNFPVNPVWTQISCQSEAPVWNKPQIISCMNKTIIIKLILR